MMGIRGKSNSAARFKLEIRLCIKALSEYSERGSGICNSASDVEMNRVKKSDVNYNPKLDISYPVFVRRGG